MGTLPVVLIFLDIDGVLIRNRTYELMASIREKLSKSNHDFHTSLQWRIILSQHLDLEAVNNLKRLIKKIETYTEPWIVLSSSWRQGVTVSEIQEVMFRRTENTNWFFANYILDRTITDLESPRKSRGEQIAHWLRHNQEKYGIGPFVILDDNDDNISEMYPNQFIRINPRDLLTEKDVEKAFKVILTFFEKDGRP